MNLAEIMKIVPIILGVGVLMLLSAISAYVLRFGLARTGIHFDYLLFVLYTVIALVLLGAI